MTNAEIPAVADRTAAVAAQGVRDAPEKASSKKGATRKKGAPKGQKAAKNANVSMPTKNAKAGEKTAKREHPKASPRPESKQAEVLELMRRKQGATLAEIMKHTGWQAHTVRGFVSGTLTKKLGLKVESFRAEDKERTYRILA